jgi:hypothetical protein
MRETKTTLIEIKVTNVRNAKGLAALCDYSFEDIKEFIINRYLSVYADRAEVYKVEVFDENIVIYAYEK